MSQRDGYNFSFFSAPFQAVMIPSSSGKITTPTHSYLLACDSLTLLNRLYYHVKLLSSQNITREYLAMLAMGVPFFEEQPQRMSPLVFFSQVITCPFVFSFEVRKPRYVRRERPSATSTLNSATVPTTSTTQVYNV